MVAGLRAQFNADVTKSKKWRLDQLRALDKMLIEGKDELSAGMKSDLNTAPFSAYMQEIAMCQQEIYDTIQSLDEWMADEVVPTNLFNAPAESIIKKDPLGVALVLGAWNYNVLLSLQPLIGAIAAGNCAILKPGSYAKGSSSAMTRLIAKYLDVTCIKCVEGNRNVTSALLEQKFDMIFFTGSPYVGKIVAQSAAKNLTPCVLELGGKSPTIITDTASIKVAADRCCWGKFMNAGQTCAAPDYFLVHEDVADKFVNECKKTITAFYDGNPKTSEWFARLINDDAFKRISKVLDDAKGKIVHGGQSDASQKFIEPTVIDFGTDLAAFEKSEAMADELFGPIMPIYRYRNLDDAIKFIRQRPKPLALYVFTEKKAIAEKVLSNTSSGAAVVNDTVVHVSNPDLPFGGVGDSGLGTYHGKKTFDAFSHLKSVLKRVTFIDPPARYPPYTKGKQFLIGMFFVPWLNHGYGRYEAGKADKKNWLIIIMLAWIVRGLLKRR